MFTRHKKFLLNSFDTDALVFNDSSNTILGALYSSSGFLQSGVYICHVCPCSPGFRAINRNSSTPSVVYVLADQEMMVGARTSSLRTMLTSLALSGVLRPLDDSYDGGAGYDR